MKQRRILCDICGKEIRWSQYLLKIPVAARLFKGSYDLDMSRCDICDECVHRIIMRINREREKGVEMNEQE